MRYYSCMKFGNVIFTLLTVHEEDGIYRFWYSPDGQVRTFRHSHSFELATIED